jgi:hypothetical protein
LFTRTVEKIIASEYHLALHTRLSGGKQEWRTIVSPRFRISATAFLSPRTLGAICVTALLGVLAGCSSPRDSSLEEFAHWHDGARALAEAGMLGWSELYKQSFDRLTALPSSLQQDTRLENTVLLLSTARKYEAQELSAQQFASERDHIETQLQARLR